MLLFVLFVAIANGSRVSFNLNHSYMTKEFYYLSFDTKYMLFDCFSQEL